MNVEDSYEGAVRRLARLGHAGLNLAPPSEDHVGESDRQRDLEELATLACEDNERLTRELESTRTEMDRLRLQVVSLQQMLAGQQNEEPVYAPRRGRSGAFYFFVIAVIGAGAAALFTFRPWDRLQPSLAMASVSTPAPTPTPAPPPPSPPIVAAPTPAPAAVAPTPAPVVPKVAATIPKVAEPTAPAHTVVPTVAARAPSPRHHAAKHHASSKKHESKHAAGKSSKPAIGDTDDPLGGTSL